MITTDLIESSEQSINPASFGRRFGAYLIDIIPLALVSLVLLYFIRGEEMFSTESWNDENEAGISPKVAIRYISILLWIVYSSIMEATRHQATVGKILLDLKVVNDYGGRLTPMESIIRNTTKLVSFLPLSLGFLWMLFNKKKKCWHDFFAGAYVVVDKKLEEEDLSQSDVTAFR